MRKNNQKEEAKHIEDLTEQEMKISKQIMKKVHQYNRYYAQ